MVDPVESQALAGNLTHAYQIISSNSGWFGNDLAAMDSTVLKTSTIENQVKDILLGRREFLPNHECVHLGGLVQTWSEHKMANVVNRYLSTKVMVNALMEGIHKQGSFNDRAQAVASYAMQCQAFQDVGTLPRDCFETSKAGAMSRIWQDAKNTWQDMNWKAKAISVATIAAVTLCGASIVALIVFAIVRTGGLAIAAIAGVGTTPISACFSRIAMNLIAATDFLGMNDAHNRAKEKTT
ncbi:hypothetical protein [Vibrio sp. McD22-P3]|uniref:hypothetical protein n=1 Tax=Vibrio sp. McD22-P3 TaxID=2724880 RepID=UPI001F214E8B|nr:hypothetical protein [Vibrio sp. McD22-P3]MCF4176136.1 hypothetical protein [Vibrio sp. McD22-P3]